MAAFWRMFREPLCVFTHAVLPGVAVGAGEGVGVGDAVCSMPAGVGDGDGVGAALVKLRYMVIT